ncbi:MAG: ATP-binding protein, partial [Xanthomonadales bacterium]|nr:ATP-binding protein [Xanthomonadales bacterium]
MTAAVPMDSARRKRVNLVASPPPRNIATDLAESVKTPTMLSIMTALAVAREMADIIVVYGAPGVGKTTSALAYLSAQFSQCNAVEQRTQPVDAPVGYVAAHPAVAGVVPLLKYVCDALGVGGIDRASGAAELHTAIVRRLTGQRCLLIVDEAQHLSGAALEQLRAIHDAAGVALALMGN